MKSLKLLVRGGVITLLVFALLRITVGLNVYFEIIAALAALVWAVAVYRITMRLEPPNLNTYKRQNVKMVNA